MKGNKKKKIFSLAAVLLVITSVLLPISTAQYGKFFRKKTISEQLISSDNSDEKVYYVAFGPAGSPNLKDCDVVLEMNETVFNNFKDDVAELKQRNLNGYETIDKQLKLFIKYGITPEYFTLKNLTEAIEELKTSNSDKSKCSLYGDTSLQVGRTTMGPHMVIYGSLFDAVVNFQPAGRIILKRPYSDINKIVDIFNISKDSSLYNLLYNVTIFHYLMYAPIELLFGGSWGTYLSLGLFPGVPTYQIIQNPFVGVYLFWFGGGIYIYQGHDKWDEGVDNALFDFIIGLTPFSMVSYREFSNPTP